MTTTCVIEPPVGDLLDMSSDTIMRVDRACATAGLASWTDLVFAATAGTLFRVDFADKRPANFVREFAAMIRASGLAMCADNRLEVYLGTPEQLKPIVATGRGAAAVALLGLGEVRPEAGAATGLSGLSGASRSAGLRQERRKVTTELDGIRVLVLDDDAVSRQVISATLKRGGSEVRGASDAESAFAMLRQAPPDLVVLDIVLGGAIDGFDFCSAMRASERCAQVPAIFVTGHSGPAFQARANDVQATAFFEKPIVGASLRAAVGRLVAA